LFQITAIDSPAWADAFESYAGFHFRRARALFFGAAAERERRGGRLSIAARKMWLMRVW
jgi:hypothetical protein